MKKSAVLVAILLSVGTLAAAQPFGPMERRSGGPVHEMSSPVWDLQYDSLGIKSMIATSDPYKANIFEFERLGEVLLNIKVDNGFWQHIPYKQEQSKAEFSDGKIQYNEQSMNGVVTVNQTFEFRDGNLHWGIHVQNNCKFPVQVGDISVTLPWKDDAEDPDEIFQTVFTKHAFVSGDASFFYFTRMNGEAPYVMVLPDKGTPCEYYTTERGRYKAFIHSGRIGPQTQGPWRQEHTSAYLAPAGEAGSSLDYGFTWQVAQSYPQMREAIYQSGSIDTKVVPGMVVPRGESARFALRTKCSIDDISAEFPDRTTIKSLGKQGDTNLYEVTFTKLGENMLTVKFDGDRKTYLEFFCSLTPKELTFKRSSFLVDHEQFRNTGKWYDGLYGEYDMHDGILHGPENPGIFDEQRTYFIASDDPCLGKAPFIASKNAVWPDKHEIESLEYHLEHFVWGGLQRTDKEDGHQYGVYGTPNWYINRHQDLRETQSDYKTNTIRTWRTYDYPHVIMLWWEMYKIARDYPQLTHFKTADECLDIAYNTARVYFIYPTELLGEYYETYKWGAYNELVIPELIDELEKNGKQAQADTLRGEWEKKVKYFVYDDKYPYRSEYAADRTAFESSYALAKYGMINNMAPDHNLWYDGNKGVWYSHPSVKKSDIRDFMERQHYANLACRGVLENQWFLLGSDFCGSSDHSLMTYMARMGGWAVLDYGLRYAEQPYDWIRLGYSSYLGPFGMMNAGDEESNYGFWYPGKDKDGALGQSFTPCKNLGTWIGTQEQRSPWRFDGEGDLGMDAITRTACTILAQDPTFGWTLYGGNLTTDKNGFSFIPDDGVDRSVYVVTDKMRYEVSIDHDHWSDTVPVRVSADTKTISLTLSAEPGMPDHVAHLCVDRIKTGSGEGGSKPSVKVAGRNVTLAKDKYGRFVCDVKVAKDSAVDITICCPAR